MSKYHSYTTHFNNQESLVAAIRMMGKQPEIGRRHLIGYHGDKRLEVADIIIPRQQISLSSNDIGFVRQDSGDFKAIVSNYDSRCYGKAWMKTLKKHYQEAEKMRAWKAEGYSHFEREEIKTKGGVKVVLRAAIPADKILAAHTSVGFSR